MFVYEAKMPRASYGRDVPPDASVTMSAANMASSVGCLWNRGPKGTECWRGLLVPVRIRDKLAAWTASPYVLSVRILI